MSGAGGLAAAVLSGDSCKAAPSLQPEIFGAPPSATFSGAGNLLEPPVGACAESVDARAEASPKR